MRPLQAALTATQRADYRLERRYDEDRIAGREEGPHRRGTFGLASRKYPRPSSSVRRKLDVKERSRAGAMHASPHLR